MWGKEGVCDGVKGVWLVGLQPPNPPAHLLSTLLCENCFPAPVETPAEVMMQTQDEENRVMDPSTDPFVIYVVKVHLGGLVSTLKVLHVTFP